MINTNVTTAEFDYMKAAEKIRHNCRRFLAMADALEGKARGEGPQPTLNQRADPAEVVLAQHLATTFTAARRARDVFFDSALFGEPAWEILLALFSHDAIGREWRSTKAVIGFSQASPSTAIRWINVLVDEGFLERDTSRDDARVRNVRITDFAVQTMYDYLREATASYAAIMKKLDAYASERS